MYRQAENLNRKLKRRESGLDTVTSEVEALHAQVAILNEELRVTQAASTELQLKNRRLERKIWAAKRRASETLATQSAMYTSSVNALCDLTDEEDIDSMRQKNRYLQDLVARLENDLLFTQEERNTIDEPGTVETFDTSGGSFKPFVHEACMTLLSHHVALEHVGQVIRSVVKSFTGREVGRLPSIGLLSQMQSEMKTVSLVHAAEQITESSYSTLHTDATTKFVRKYSGYQVTTKEGALSLGLLELHTGSAQHTLDAFQNLLSDMNLACSAAGVGERVSLKLVEKIKSTLSDRGSVEKAFNTIFDNFRSSLLPSLYENWAQLPAVARDKISTVHHFFCGLHYLVGLAEQSEAVFSEWEKVHFEGKVGAGALPFTFETGPGIVRLIRNACKSFTKHGSEQAGCCTDFHTFVEDRGRSFSLTSSEEIVLTYCSIMVVQCITCVISC